METNNTEIGILDNQMMEEINGSMELILDRRGWAVGYGWARIWWAMWGRCLIRFGVFMTQMEMEVERTGEAEVSNLYKLFVAIMGGRVSCSLGKIGLER